MPFVRPDPGRRVPLAGAITCAPAAEAKRKKVAQVVAPKKERPREVDLSKGGTQRGGLEFALGSITAVLSGVLVGRGVWELVNAERIADACAAGETNDPTCQLDAKPGRAGRVAGGLAIGFAVPMAIASGFLFRRAVRVHRDWKTWHARAGVTAWGDRTGGGVGLRLRF